MLVTGNFLYWEIVAVIISYLLSIYALRKMLTNRHFQKYPLISRTVWRLYIRCLALVLHWCWICANVLDKWGLKQLDVRHRMSRFANAGLPAKLSPVLSLLWKLKGVGCVSCAFYNVLTLEVDMLTAVSSVCSLQLLLTRQSVRSASQCSTEKLLLGEPALAGSKGLLGCPQESHCASLSAAQPYTQQWPRGGSSGPSAKSASSLQIAEKHRAVSAAFTAAEFNCDSNEECTQQRRGAGLGQGVGHCLHEDSPILCCLTLKLGMVVVPLC